MVSSKKNFLRHPAPLLHEDAVRPVPESAHAISDMKLNSLFKILQEIANLLGLPIGCPCQVPEHLPAIPDRNRNHLEFVTSFRLIGD